MRKELRNLNKEINTDKLEFNTYFIFEEEAKSAEETVELIFKDYIEKRL